MMVMIIIVSMMIIVPSNQAASQGQPESQSSQMAQQPRQAVKNPASQPEECRAQNIVLLASQPGNQPVSQPAKVSQPGSQAANQSAIIIAR